VQIKFQRSVPISLNRGRRKQEGGLGAISKREIVLRGNSPCAERGGQREKTCHLRAKELGGGVKGVFPEKNTVRRLVIRGKTW